MLILALGPGARPGEALGEPGWLSPGPAVLGRPLPGVGTCGVSAAVRVPWIRHRRSASSDCSGGELGFEGTVRGRRAVTIIE